MKTIRVEGKNEEILVGKILCLGSNYVDHVKEMGLDIPREPMVFIKPSTAIVWSGEDIVIPGISQEMHHEVEFVIAIGKNGRSIPTSESLRHVLGYGVGLDMTLRDMQREARKKGSPWSIAKGFDTSAPISEIIPVSKIKDPKQLVIRCRVNGQLRQEGLIRDMILGIENIIEYVSSVFTLEQIGRAHV